MDNLNDLFKKKLSEQQFEGKEKYWTELEKKLAEHAQEKTVIAWYKRWLLPMFAIAAIGVMATLLYTNNAQKITAPKANPNSEQLASAQEVVSKNKNESKVNLSAPATNQNVVPGTALNSTVQPQNETATFNSNTLTSNNTNKTSKPSNQENTADKTAMNSFNNSSSQNSSSIFNNNEANSSKLTKEPVLSNSDIDETQTNYTLVNSLATDNNSENSSPSATENKTLITNTTVKALDFSQLTIPLATLSPKALSAMLYPVTASSLASNLAPVNSNKTKSNLSLSVYGGAMFSLKNLMTSDGNTADYLSKRKNEELNPIKPNAGIDIELKRGHWTLTSGVNFHQQGEKRNYSDQFKRIVPYDSLVININNNSAWLTDSTVFYALQYANVMSSFDTTITYYDETTGLFYSAQLPVNLTQSIVIDTNFFYLIDSTYQQNVDTLKTNYALKKQIVVNDPNQPNLKGRNTFSYVELPVLIGYEWGIKRWRLSLKGGIGVGILTRQQSFYLTTDEAEIAPVSTDVYTKIMYNGIVRAGLHYNFTTQFGIDIVPFSRININNMTNNKATFQQKYNNIGLQVGLNYKL